MTEVTNDILDDEWQGEPTSESVEVFVSSDKVILNSNPDHVVIIMHGIRNKALWYQAIKNASLKAGYNVDVELVSMGFVNPISFIFGINSENKEYKAVSDINFIINNYKNRNEDTSFSLMCHSYSTKIIANIILRTNTKYKYIFLCGSVCNLRDLMNISSGSLDSNNASVRSIIGDCSTKDIYPLLAYSINPLRYFYSGTFGFGNARCSDRFWEKGHSYYTTLDHFVNHIFPMVTGRPFVLGEDPGSTLKHFYVYVIRAILILIFVIFFRFIF